MNRDRDRNRQDDPKPQPGDLERLYLTPEMEHQLAGLRFPIPVTVEGRLAGVHASPQPGASVEFAEHKEYEPGDDLRHINWKAYARTDEFHIRQFTRDTHAEVYLVLDESGSMDYRSQHAPESKLSFASRLATALAYVFLRQNDSVGLLTLSGRGLTNIVPARSHPSQLINIQAVLSDLFEQHRTRESRVEGASEIELEQGLNFLSSRHLRHSAVIVISDLFMDETMLFRFLSNLRVLSNYCWLIHVLDPAEWDLEKSPASRTFPFDGTILFRSPETGAGLLMDARVGRGAYVTRFSSWLDGLQAKCGELRVKYGTCNTDYEPLHVILQMIADKK